VPAQPERLAFQRSIVTRAGGKCLAANDFRGLVSGIVSLPAQGVKRRWSERFSAQFRAISAQNLPAFRALG
jgi:hypothetical protein